MRRMAAMSLMRLIRAVHDDDDGGADGDGDGIEMDRQMIFYCSHWHVQTRTVEQTLFGNQFLG